MTGQTMHWTTSASRRGLAPAALLLLACLLGAGCGMLAEDYQQGYRAEFLPGQTTVLCNAIQDAENSRLSLLDPMSGEARVVGRNARGTFHFLQEEGKVLLGDSAANRVVMLHLDSGNVEDVTPVLVKEGEQYLDAAPGAERLVIRRGDPGLMGGEALYFGKNLGGFAREITCLKDRELPAALAFSPDARRMAYSDAGNIFLVDLENDSLGLLYESDRELSPESLTFSPDGLRLLAADAATLIELEVDTAKGGAFADFEGLGRLLGPPQYFPDGQRVLFPILFDGLDTEAVSGYFAIGRDGEGLKLITPANPLHPAAFSHDGKRIVFDTSDGEGGTALAIVHADGSGRRRLLPRGEAAAAQAGE